MLTILVIFVKPIRSHTHIDRFGMRGGIWRIARRTVIMNWNINQPGAPNAYALWTFARSNAAWLADPSDRRALAQNVDEAGGEVSLFLLHSLGHVEWSATAIPHRIADGLQLWRAAYALLAFRDRLPPPAPCFE